MNQMEYRQQREYRQQQELKDLQAWEHERDHWIYQAIEEYLCDEPNTVFVDAILRDYNVSEEYFEQECLRYIDSL